MVTFEMLTRGPPAGGGDAMQLYALILTVSDPGRLTVR